MREIIIFYIVTRKLIFLQSFFMSAMIKKFANQSANQLFKCRTYFSKFYGKLGIISIILVTFPSHKKKLRSNFYTEILTWKVELWFFFTHFTHEKIPQNNFCRQNFSVGNIYFCTDVWENKRLGNKAYVFLNPIEKLIC